MAKTPEGKVKDGVRKRLKEAGIWFYQPIQNGMGRVGIPDFICCYNGRFLAIETKAPGKINNTTPNQEQVLKEIRESGGYSLVLDDPERLDEHLAAVRLLVKLTG